jgi:hypothetical protein
MATKGYSSKHDREINAIRTLLKEGMRLQVETRKDLRALAAMQKRSDARLKVRLGGVDHS